MPWGASTPPSPRLKSFLRCLAVRVPSPTAATGWFHLWDLGHGCREHTGHDFVRSGLSSAGCGRDVLCNLALRGGWRETRGAPGTPPRSSTGRSAPLTGPLPAPAPADGGLHVPAPLDACYGLYSRELGGGSLNRLLLLHSAVASSLQVSAARGGKPERAPGTGTPPRRPRRSARGCKSLLGGPWVLHGASGLLRPRRGRLLPGMPGEGPTELRRAAVQTGLGPHGAPTPRPPVPAALPASSLCDSGSSRDRAQGGSQRVCRRDCAVHSASGPPTLRQVSGSPPCG